MLPIHLFCQLLFSIYYPPCFLSFSECRRGTSWFSSFRYFIVFFVISHILSSMLEINIYSIMDSNVFGVTIHFNFLLAIVEEKFND
jgi:hypothetical protein